MKLPRSPAGPSVDILLVVLIILLIAMNAFLVAVEFALVRVRPSRLELLAKRGNPSAEAVQGILSRFDQYLASIQLGLAVISLILGWLGAPFLAGVIKALLAHLGASPGPRALTVISFASAIILLSIVTIVFGELIPRTLGIQRAERVALWSARALVLYSAAFRVPTRFMAACAQLILSPLKLKPALADESLVSEEELRLLLGESEERGAFTLERLFLLENLFDLGRAKVREAMVPREQIAFLSTRKSWDENLKTMETRRFSRYPLCDGDLDHPLGLVHIKDLALQEADIPNLKALRREISFIGEDEPLETLLKLFPDRGIHMALVKDKDGKVSGLLTLEDIVEELVGEIRDEFDATPDSLLSDALAQAEVNLHLQAADRKSLIRALINPLKARYQDLDAEGAFMAVWQRELKFSSAIGRGIAVPHARLPGVPKPLISFGRLAKPLPFPGPDTAPVRLAFLILSPESAPAVQLKVLSRVAALGSNDNLRKRLLRAKTPEALISILKTADTLLAS